MAENSGIGWTDHTFNPWIGCTETSPACDFCYARDLSARRGWAEWGAGKSRKRTAISNWRKPLSWNARAGDEGVRYKVFCASLADWADAEIEPAWRNDLIDLIVATPNLDWLLLSKRHNLIMKYLPREPLKNVRVGLTMEDNLWATTRMNALMNAAHWGWRTFISYEPAIGPIDWRRWSRQPIGRIIIGCESGANSRPFDEDWARATRDFCQENGTAFFYKQAPGGKGPKYVIEAPTLDGRTWQEWDA